MLLAIDSATRQLGLALHDGAHVLVEMSWRTRNNHTVELAPAIQYVLSSIGVTTADLTALAAAQGPGSFNGLRIGLSLAKGMAMALRLPLFIVPTLDVVAAAQGQFEGALLAVAEAGRGRVVAGTYHWRDGRWQGNDDVRIAAWPALIEEISGPALVAGEIDEAAHELLARRAPILTVAAPAACLRRAAFLADLAWQQQRNGDPGDPLLAVPFYLHQPGVPHP
jgi:tRNA threonylcarbamoyladenosine biosynthesis protein TsaB